MVFTATRILLSVQDLRRQLWDHLRHNDVLRSIGLVFRHTTTIIHQQVCCEFWARVTSARGLWTVPRVAIHPRLLHFVGLPRVGTVSGPFLRPFLAILSEGPLPNTRFLKRFAMLDSRFKQLTSASVSQQLLQSAHQTR